MVGTLQEITCPGIWKKEQVSVWLLSKKVECCKESSGLFGVLRISWHALEGDGGTVPGGTNEASLLMWQEQLKGVRGSPLESTFPTGCLSLCQVQGRSPARRTVLLLWRGSRAVELCVLELTQVYQTSVQALVTFRTERGPWVSGQRRGGQQKH